MGLRLDLHVHSGNSPDGRADLRALVERAGVVRLDGFALTDHNTVDGHPRLRELQLDHPELHLLPGVEVSTREGHLLAYGVDAAPRRGLPVEEVIDWVRAHGGVPVLAHPFRLVHGVGGSVARQGRVAVIEVVNGHNSAAANGRAREVAEARTLGSSGGSDAHDVAELGRAWTIFPDGLRSPDELLGALEKGHVVGAGTGGSFPGRVRAAFRSFGLRLGRGLRPI